MKKLEITNTEFIQALGRFTKRLHTQGASIDQVYIKPNMAKEFLYFMEQKGKTKLSQINQQIVNSYFNYLKERPNQTKDGGLSDGYIAKHREVVLRFIEFALCMTGIEVEKGQSGIIVKLIKSDTIPKVILLEHEIEKMYEASTDCTMLGIRDKVILSLLYGCGLRRKELRTLEVNEIDLNKGMIHLPLTKTKYAREVPMTPRVQRDVEEYLFNVRNMMLDATSELTNFLITERGTVMSNSTIGKMMEKVSEKTNIGKTISCHVLRHSIATHLHRNMKLEDVATFLGHRNLDSTMIYTHLKKEYYG